MLRSWRRTALLTFVVGTVLVLSSCTPSGYLGARGTVAIGARSIGISVASKQVTCQPVDGVTAHRCTAPVGVGGAAVVLDVQVGSITTATESKEMVVVTFPASLGRDAFHRSEAGWTYVTQCGWKKKADGTWAKDPSSPARTFLLDENDQFVLEV